MNQIVMNLKRAVIELLLLTLLTEEDKYGYQLTQEIKKRTNGKLTILEGSMYTVLNRLKEDGDVTFRHVQSGPRMVRVYYSITDIGRQHLQEKRAIYDEYTQIIYDFIEQGENNAENN